MSLNRGFPTYRWFNRDLWKLYDLHKISTKFAAYHSYIYLVFVVSDSFLSCFISTTQFKNVNFYPYYEIGLQMCMRLLPNFLGDYLKNAKKLEIICTVSSAFAAGLYGFIMLMGWLVLGVLLVWGFSGNVWRDRPFVLSCWASSYDGRSIPKKQKQKQVPWDSHSEESTTIFGTMKVKSQPRCKWWRKGAFVS